jgi:hypothetical protein
MIRATKPPPGDTADDDRTDAVACLARLRATLTILDDCLDSELAVSPPSPGEAIWADEAALELRLLAI